MQILRIISDPQFPFPGLACPISISRFPNSQVFKSRLMGNFLRCESCQKCLILTVLCINKVKAPISLKSHERPVCFGWPNIGKLNSLRNICCQPGQHLHLKGIWTRLPPQFVNVRANKPVKGSSCRSTEEYYRWCYCTLQDHIHIRGCHERYNGS